jgi:hypothetical protein
MPRKVTNKPVPEVGRRARAIVKALALSGARHEDAIQFAVDCKWVMRGEGNTACLTDEGRKLITKGFN